MKRADPLRLMCKIQGNGGRPIKRRTMKKRMRRMVEAVRSGKYPPNPNVKHLFNEEGNRLIFGKDRS